MNRKETVTLLEAVDWSPKLRKEMVCRLYDLMDRREFIKALCDRYTDGEMELFSKTLESALAPKQNKA